LLGEGRTAEHPARSALTMAVAENINFQCAVRLVISNYLLAAKTRPGRNYYDHLQPEKTPGRL
jgi:hypothetical protein